MSTSEPQSSARLPVGIRATGVVIAAGYLLGIVPGPLVSVIGAFALVTFARALVIDRDRALRSGLSLAVIAAALGVGALRWGTLELAELRGVQSVLGPSILVGPIQAAIACGAAAVAAVLALSSWLREPEARGFLERLWMGAEAGLWALAILTVFFVPARSVLEGAGVASAALEIARWVGAIVVTAGAAFGLSLLQERLDQRMRLGVLVLAGSLVLFAAVLVAGVL